MHDTQYDRNRSQPQAQDQLDEHIRRAIVGVFGHPYTAAAPRDTIND